MLHPRDLAVLLDLLAHHGDAPVSNIAVVVEDTLLHGDVFPLACALCHLLLDSCLLAHNSASSSSASLASPSVSSALPQPASSSVTSVRHALPPACQRLLALYLLHWLGTHNVSRLSLPPFLSLLLDAAVAPALPGAAPVLSDSELRLLSVLLNDKQAATRACRQAPAALLAALSREAAPVPTIADLRSSLASLASSSSSSSPSSSSPGPSSTASMATSSSSYSLPSSSSSSSSSPLSLSSIRNASDRNGGTRGDKAGKGRSDTFAAMAFPLAVMSTFAVPSASAPRTIDPALLAPSLDLRPVAAPFPRPPPSPMAPLPCELTWINPETTPELAWDDGQSQGSPDVSELTKAVQLAMTQQLVEAKAQQIISALRQDSRLVHIVGVTPATLSSLIQHNPSIAYQVLLLVKQSSRFSEYLTSIVSTDISLRSLEVVQQLINSVALPTEFVHLYISQCIASCENLTDPYVQNRLVRLVCVFLQALIRNKTIQGQDLLAEVQAFCVQFGKIREAASLFRLLRSME